MKKTLAILIMAFVLGCDRIDAVFNRYEIKHEDGKTIRLDKRTGEIYLIEGDRLVKIKSLEEIEKENAELTVLKSWQEIGIENLGKGVTASLSTSWHDGFLYYQFDLRPFPKAKISSLTITLQDKDGFKIADQNIHRLELLSTVDAQGKPLGLSSNESLLLSKENYIRINSWNLSWKNY